MSEIRNYRKIFLPSHLIQKFGVMPSDQVQALHRMAASLTR